MEALCDEADRRGLRMRLHTNLEANVRYYAAMGFETERESQLRIGAREWLMVREPRNGAP